MVASVWGPPTADGQLRPWRGTANGLEAVAAETSDTLLILDEMGQADPREVGDIVYLLGNEAGKQRASRTGTARRRHFWRTLFLRYWRNHAGPEDGRGRQAGDGRAWCAPPEPAS